MGQRAQRVVVATAGQSELAQRRRQHRAHPHRLLAVLGALQRVRDRHQHALAHQRAGECRERLGGHAANAGRPGAVLDHAIRAAQQVVLKGVPAVATARDKVAVERAVLPQLVHQAEHQRRIGHGRGGDPLGVDVGGQIAAQRAHVDEAAAAPRRRQHGAALGVAADAARRHA
ncbi:hypothetical protein SDC9_164059 [bioreactor metagenome]|uniref:Uncharacterized protein n=1 Tax=bioreactor metagenome TaxID=1076179 RepID=A0A645FXU2_9ZZZZ